MGLKAAWRRRLRRHRLFLALAAVGAALRIQGLAYGLPAVFNGDEPHHVNVAMSFGRGTLNPGIFKYPTLWMYALFALYAAGYMISSGAGLLRPPEWFGTLFAQKPGAFYLAGRALAAAFSLGGLWWVYRAGCLVGGRRTGALAAALLAVSPGMIESAHAAKPENLMFFWAAWAWWQAMAYFHLGGRRRLVFCGALVGLAVTTQYTAAPLAVLPPAAWAARAWRVRGRPPSVELFAAAGAAILAFCLGTPFAVLDASAFLRDLRDGWSAHAVGTTGPAGLKTLRSFLDFSGTPRLGGFLLLAGAAAAFRARRAAAAVLIIPCAALVLFFSRQAIGGNIRYLFSAFPAAATLAAFGTLWAMRLLPGFSARRRGLLASLLLLPGAIAGWRFDRELLLPDTRTIAADWIKAHVPPGARILSDHETDSPYLPLSRDFARRMHESTRAAGHPRQHYYRLLADAPGSDGYAVFQVKREASELIAGTRHVRWSESGRPILDVKDGLGEARAAGIELVILTSYGLARREDSSYVRQARGQGRLLAEFSPLAGSTRGPRIEIYALSR